MAAAAKDEAKNAQPDGQPANAETTEAKAAPDKSNMRQNLTGKQKAAMLLISIGAEKSAEIMRHLKDEEIEEVTKAIAGIKKLNISKLKAEPYVCQQT